LTKGLFIDIINIVIVEITTDVQGEQTGYEKPEL
jgi:hypothetical protein